jgi:RimJ/RimL family protein N-acetyltransferase
MAWQPPYDFVMGPIRAPLASAPGRRSTAPSAGGLSIFQLQPWRVIAAPRLDLAVLPGALLDACLAGDLAAARKHADFLVPDDFDTADEWIGLRRAQVLADPAWEPWSLRAMVLRDQRRMVGFTSFHGPPGINSLDAPDAAEIGYTVFPAHQSRGFATETARAMMGWATQTHGIHRFISSIEPTNFPSLRVVEKLGFQPLNLILDGEAIFELRVPGASDRS